ncbi:MAG: GH116 family glycosyl-hydrolase [FCB group bacterium]|jgi:uncharacterized protein (DUF608 family)|nr:GH116 family glycosyl-hydrolase [FCB group bacterium]
MSEAESKKCCGSGCGVDRREFLKLAAASAAAASMLGSWRPVMAGPFSSEDFERLIPADKKLDPAWVSSLFERGEPAWRRGDELKYIGMPVGGICAGQVYLAGDGRLWLWDVFNQYSSGVGGCGTTGELYVKPLEPISPFKQGFAIRVRCGDDVQVRALDQSGFKDVAFLGAYPVGQVRYRDEAASVEVDLDAFSPFIPLNADDSALPATVMSFTLRNTGARAISVDLAGWMENPVCLQTKTIRPGLLRNRVAQAEGFTFLGCSAAPPADGTASTERPDIVFEDFEKDSYEGWTVTGTAFGPGPVEASKMPAYQGEVGAQGSRLVNTHNTRQMDGVTDPDAHIGTLTSAPFTVERNCINLLIGGGNHGGETCVNLLVDGQVVRSATGKNDNKLSPCTWGVANLQGKTAQIQIVDAHTGGWGNIGIDHIVFSDRSAQAAGPLEQQGDFGTMGLVLLGQAPADRFAASLPESATPEAVFAALEASGAPEVETPFSGTPTGALLRTVELAPGAEATVNFAFAWHFPNLNLTPFTEPVGRHYAKRFAAAQNVAEHLAANFDRLAGDTRRWRDTWYDSTLPYWFLDRTFANTSTLATSTAFRFADGRFYGWEGVGCCQGTCTHVWHYAHAVGRVFPELERDTRERVDFGLSFDEKTGLIAYRGEFARTGADDGQAGTVLRAYREHQMSADRGFLERNWPRIKKGLQYLIDKDGNADGIIEGAQPNTLDADWFGQVPWLVSLYLAALRAGELMAIEMNDAEFAATTLAIREKGAARLVGELFNGEYFFQKLDPAHADAIGVGDGCHIDQVFGQSWAFQVGLGRLYAEEPTRKALHALWRYNFTPDVGPFKEVYKKGRPYALAGDGGLIMCTWPKGGHREAWDREGVSGYFNECMSGFEHQVAGHMIWEGLVQEGLAVERAIHDRYHPRLRNPYNEIECSDHYSRAMASYGAFLAACGYEYHGPKGHIGFAPRLSPENFRAPFTAAEGWGTYAQTREGGTQRSTLTMRHGQLRLRTLALEFPGDTPPTRTTVTLAGQPVPASFARDGHRIEIALGNDVTLAVEQDLIVDLT